MKSIFFFILIACGINAWADDFENGKIAFQNKDFPSALQSFKKSASSGVSQANYYIGFIYEIGLSVSPDFSEAAKWYRIAAEEGSSDAKVRLAYLYRTGNGVKKNYAEALKLYKSSAEQGNISGQYILANWYYRGEYTLQDFLEAFRFYKLAADNGHRNSQYFVGKLYANGESGMQNYVEALKWYKLSAAQGNSVALLRLAYMYKDGLGVEKDISQAYILSRASEMARSLEIQKYRRPFFDEPISDIVFRDIISRKEIITREETDSLEPYIKQCYESNFKNCFK
jgi:TPR repeat protein